MQVAFPLLTLLTCLEDDAAFRRNIDSHTDKMNRQLRVSFAFKQCISGRRWDLLLVQFQPSMLAIELA